MTRDERTAIVIHIASYETQKGRCVVNQLTVRGFGDDLSAYMRRLAKREGISLNQAVLKLLRKGAGLTNDAGRADTVGVTLDHLIGAWTSEEADEMDSALEEFETVDEAAWK